MAFWTVFQGELLPPDCLHPQTGAQPHQAAGILRDIGLIQRRSHPKPPILSPGTFLQRIKSRHDNAFSASSCRKTLENRLSMLPAQWTSGAGPGASPRHTVSTLVCGKSRNVEFQIFRISKFQGWTQWQLRPVTRARRDAIFFM